MGAVTGRLGGRVPRGVVLALLLAGCGATPRATSSARTIDAHHGAMGEIVGLTTRDEIESEIPAWRDARLTAELDRDAATRLAGVPEGAEVTVFLGTWCGDSRREVSRLFAALEQAGTLPFEVTYIGVDRSKRAPGLTEGVDLRYVPTIVVRRDGAEVGRIVESAPLGVERALLELLSGARSGVISGRADL